jgi:hypothetical protein
VINESKKSHAGDNPMATGKLFQEFPVRYGLFMPAISKKKVAGHE